jgi:hypothetical protein
MAFKNYLILFLVMCTCVPAIAQTSVMPDTAHHIIRICAPSRAQMLVSKPLVVVFANGKEIIRTSKADTAAFGIINPDDIQSINVLKDTTATKKYGKNAIAGVIEVYLKDGKYPATLKQDTLKRKDR